MIRLIFITLALILGLPSQLASSTKTLVHLSEHKADHHDEDDHHHSSDHDHDSPEHDHGDGTPPHSHEKELTGVLAPLALSPAIQPLVVRLQVKVIPDYFSVPESEGRATFLLVLRPPIFA